MFCLFADDTGIFEKDHFFFYLENRTNPDGSDLGGHLLTLFDVLNTPENERQKTLDEDLARFPYVNGALFKDHIRPVSFDSAMREALLQCCRFDWTKVSPALFGSLFQTVMLPEEQRKKGAHYTSEKNILKVIKPLFLDELWEEFERIKNNKKRLEEFHEKLSQIRIMDPACGCGNFLILAYRELRDLEIEVLKAINPKDRHGLQTRVLDISSLSRIDVDQFYGIELEEFPARIAEVAMWLIDHQMNIKLSEVFGQAYVRLPLKKSAKILHGNALTIDWRDLLEPERCSYIISNPPFIGSKYMTAEQRAEIAALFPGLKVGVLDYVCGWYAKASEYMKGTEIKAAFVSTNSITQGEQVGILWHELIKRRGIHIHFAHRTFKWTIDAKRAKGMNVAAVYVVIIGFAEFEPEKPRLFEYETITAEPHEAEVKRINPYLVDGPDAFIFKRTKPLSGVPGIKFGNQPIDGGNLILTETEYTEAVASEPDIKPLLRKYIGAEELINGTPRWCLWLKDADPSLLRKSDFIKSRLESTRDFRLKSKREATNELAKTPALFGFISHEETRYVAIPSVSSERRPIVPIEIFNQSTICSNLCLIIPEAQIYHFGILTSEMHMAWMRHVCGRLKSDYRYSNTLVYNNFPWPEPTGPQRKKIEEAAQAVLDARAKYPNSSLADLYDPNTMPPVLLKAHQELDRAVDAAYRRTPFKDERTRIEFLFELYQKLASPLEAKGKKKGKKKK
jgi:hypothetical protein